MQWRCYVTGASHDLELLMKALSDGELVAHQDAHGTYLTSPSLDALSGDAALAYARGMVFTANAVGRLQWSGYTPVSFDQATYSATVIDADGTAHGTAGGGYVTYVALEPPGPMNEALTTQVVSSADGSGHYSDALQIIGRAPQLDWPALHKVHELLEADAGGADGLAQRSGISKTTWARLTMSANHPAISTYEARHAIMKGQPEKSKGMTIEVAREIVMDTLRGWAQT